MKSMFAAIGALALATSVANAAPAPQRDHQRHVGVQSQQLAAAMSKRRNADFDPRDWSTNRGAGQSRSQDANNG